MISTKHRFHGHGSLRYVYQHGKTVRSQTTALKFVQNERRKSYRLAVVVSKKVSKSAVVRNRIRRRIYEIVRMQEDRITKPHDLVITVFSDQLLSIEHKRLEEQITTQLTQAGVIS